MFSIRLANNITAVAMLATMMLPRKHDAKTVEILTFGYPEIVDIWEVMFNILTLLFTDSTASATS